jgi:hypothetical protein
MEVGDLSNEHATKYCLLIDDGASTACLSLIRLSRGPYELG